MIVDERRDHFFRIPRPDESARWGTPNACNSCHGDKTAGVGRRRRGALVRSTPPGRLPIRRGGRRGPGRRGERRGRAPCCGGGYRAVGDCAGDGAQPSPWKRPRNERRPGHGNGRPGSDRSSHGGGRTGRAPGRTSDRARRAAPPRPGSGGADSGRARPRPGALESCSQARRRRTSTPLSWNTARDFSRWRTCRRPT